MDISGLQAAWTCISQSQMDLKLSFHRLKGKRKLRGFNFYSLLSDLGSGIWWLKGGRRSHSENPAFRQFSLGVSFTLNSKESWLRVATTLEVVIFN